MMTAYENDYSKIGMLVTMGFDVAKAIDALASCGGDVERACNCLLAQQRSPASVPSPSWMDRTMLPQDYQEDGESTAATAPRTMPHPIPPPVSSYPDLSQVPSELAASNRRKWYAPSDYNGDDDDDDSNVTFFEVFFPQWSGLTEAIRESINMFVVTLAVGSTYRPKTVLSVITAFSFLVVAVGFFTNFKLILDLTDLFAPIGSKPSQHSAWINSDDGFPDRVDPLGVIIHRDGENVLTESTVRRSFEALDTIRNSSLYYDLCGCGIYYDFDGELTCRILSLTRYWDHDIDKFNQDLLLHRILGFETTDEYIQHSFSQGTFPDGTPIFHEGLLGNFQRGPDDTDDDDVAALNGLIENFEGLIDFAQSMQMIIYIPDRPELETMITQFNREMLGELANMRNDWKDDPNITENIEFLNFMAYRFEFERGVVADLPLVPTVVVVMVGFACSIFYRQDRIHSRSMLGLGAVVTIVMSLLSTFGIMFIFGVPFNTLTLILPFVVVGVGLDDTFIITGEYFRTDPKLPVSARVWTCMEEVGVSITLTTTTTCLAFLLGFMSSLPGVRWLCIYAFLTIFIDFIYQITYFVALITLNERRIAARRMDCCVCVKVPLKPGEEPSTIDTIYYRQQPPTPPTDVETSQPKKKEKHIADRFMIWYADILLKPFSKFLVLSFFGCLTIACSYSVSKLKQDFRVEDYLPIDSYIRGFLQSTDLYSDKIWTINVYFRDIDQSNATVQREMIQYVNDLSELPQIGQKPDFCWVSDFQRLLNETGNADDVDFNFFLNIALNNPTFREFYGPDIVRDENNTITASRCYLILRNLDLGDVNDQINMLLDQREITENAPLNIGKSDWSMFTFDTIYFFWEAYVVSVRELIFTMVSGLIAVSVVALLLMPHWTAVFFVTPMISVMYVNYLGTIQWFGLTVNGLTYICVVISIGLLVDFIMHILLRYYEMPRYMSRDQKVKRTMETMGASMLIGGLTTFLGVCPLFFSTTAILQLVFTALWTLVGLGCIHGLILLPVLLSIFGPESDPDDLEDDEDDESSLEDMKEYLQKPVTKMESAPTSILRQPKHTPSSNSSVGHVPICAGVQSEDEMDDVQLVKRNARLARDVQG